MPRSTTGLKRSGSWPGCSSCARETFSSFTSSWTCGGDTWTHCPAQKTPHRDPLDSWGRRRSRHTCLATKSCHACRLCYYLPVNTNQLFISLPKAARIISTLFLAGTFVSLVGCKQPVAASAKANTTPPTPAIAVGSPSTNKLAKRFTYTPRPYPVDERGFSPADKEIGRYYAREEM